MQNSIRTCLSQARGLVTLIVVALWLSVYFSQTALAEPTSHELALNGDKNRAKSNQHAFHATIQGIVIDFETEKPVLNASVVLTPDSKGEKRLESETKEDGSFSFVKLEPGAYSLTFSAQNKFTKREKITVAAKETKSIKVVLKDREVTDVMHLTGQRTLIHPENIGNTTVIDKKYLDQIGNGNNLKAVIETTPGMMPDSVGVTVTRGEHYATSYTLDGALIPEAAGVVQQGQFASPRSLQSVSVDIGGYAASDGGAPMGAIVRMKSMPLESKPTFQLGTQLGGPLSGGVNYYGSSALSQDAKSMWNRVRFESSGSIFASKLGLEPGTKQFRRDARIDINSLSKIVFQATDRDRLTLHIAINESYMHQPSSPESRAAGVKVNEHDRQNFIMLSYRHRFQRFFEEANLHAINSFYSQRISQPNVFDPDPIINGDYFQRSAAVNAKRFNYVISAQGDISKTLFKTHSLKAGFLTNLTFCRTQFSEWVYDANPADSAYGQIISAFTGAPGGPNFQGNMGKYTGSQWIQGAYVQDTWHSDRSWLKRLTLNYGARFDLSDSFFGNANALGNTVAQLYQGPFNMQPFRRQTVTNAQVSGRYGGTFAINKSTLLRASFSNLFVPNPVDYFLTPFLVTGGPYPYNGIFDGSPRPLQAMRGRLVDAGIEKQFGKRFVVRNNVFYKDMSHMGDTNVIDNSIVYNRLTTNGEAVSGIETRLELKPARDGTGVYGYVSNTIADALLRGTRLNDGLFWYSEPAPRGLEYPDHDRREALSAGLGCRNKHNCWILATVSAFTGFQDQRDPAIYGAHPARVPPAYFIGLNAGASLPKKFKDAHHFCPDSVELRIQNLTNNVVPINLGSPFQGTRYSLPIRILVCTNWNFDFGSGKSKLAGAQTNLAGAHTSGNN